MIPNDLLHILDGTHCLSKRQLRDYAAGRLSREEAHAVECHLAECPLCSTAADGMLAHFPESAAVLAEVDTGFLKEHFKNHSPQIHLNSVAPPAAIPAPGRRTPRHAFTLPSWRTLGVAAAMVLLIGSIWWMQQDDEVSDSDFSSSAPIAQAESSQGGLGSPAQQQPMSDAATLRTATEIPSSQQAPVVQPAPPEKKAEGMEANGLAAAVANQTASATGSATAPALAQTTPANNDNGNVSSGNNTQGSAAPTDDAIIPSDVRTRRYEQTITEPTSTANKESEKAPTRNPVDVAPLTAGAYQNRTAPLSMPGKEADVPTSYEVAVDGLNAGKDLYNSGSYASALKVFRKQMSTASGSDREEAMLYAARCHLALGQKDAAKKLFGQLAEGSGSRSRLARRELRRMESAAEESGRHKAKEAAEKD